MPRYIDIDKYKKWDGIPKCKDCRHSYVITDYCLECYYDNGGEENISPILHAKWEFEKDSNIATCSNCNYRMGVGLLVRYCPYCGAKIN